MGKTLSALMLISLSACATTSTNLRLIDPAAMHVTCANKFDPLSNSLRGCYYDTGFTTNQIVIRNDLTEEETLCVLKHELKHKYKGDFHHGTKRHCTEDDDLDQYEEEAKQLLLQIKKE